MVEFFYALVSIAGIILSYYLGIRREKIRQSLIVRSQMLDPIDKWLSSAEEQVSMLSDTIVAINQGLSGPTMYNMEERLQAAKSMSQQTNRLYGILKSDSLKTKQTAKNSDVLNSVIKYIDDTIKYQILPLGSQIISASNSNLPIDEHINKGLTIKIDIDEKLQRAYELIARIRRALT